MPTTPCAFPGSQPFTRKSLGLYKFSTIQTTPYAGAASQKLQHFLMLVQAPDASHATPYVVQVPKDSNNSLRLCRLAKIDMQILMLVQVPNASHAHPSACKDS
ncbi:hypothetical protein O181_045795 [Austropuccinia psidii MF-1]|uniref:Uncharacterized protein n=1 Tax=Austropuccinia psidii MF-1 TaxID=1389203 RepID=A0A9Q3HLJ1_9BASI|nr:hypothetical protein [Austropuccinia psidii MF-1]